MEVSLHKCTSYDNNQVRTALSQIFDDFGGIDKIVKPNTTVFLKINLVEKYNPKKACTTNPVVVEELAKLITQQGAKCIVGDSPAVFFNRQHVSAVYNVCQITDATKNSGAELNDNFNSNLVYVEDGKMAKNIEIIDAATSADIIINCTKFKSHSLTGHTGAVKNLFGLIPGLIKTQMHANYPKIHDFCDFLIDVERAVKNKLVFNIIDGIVGMEGPGPTSGTPIACNCLIGAPNAYACDICEALLMGLEPNESPLLVCAKERGIIESYDLKVIGEPLESMIIPNFKNIKVAMDSSAHVIPKWLQPVFNRFFKKVPIIQAKQCKGCEKCKNHCPNKAISIKNRKNGTKFAKIDYKQCISCFCCQELCPFHVVKVRTPIGYKIIQRKQLKRNKK
ncbi:MAG: DUF362 domain-containing protein [Clostridia bacterium]|nr:DUF362 domain-containing protein [Clostridia bacterium]